MAPPRRRPRGARARRLDHPGLPEPDGALCAAPPAAARPSVRRGHGRGRASCRSAGELRGGHLGAGTRPGQRVGPGRRARAAAPSRRRSPPSPPTTDPEHPPSSGSGDLALRPRWRREVDAGRAPAACAGGLGIRRGGGVDQARSRPGARPVRRTRQGRGRCRGSGEREARRRERSASHRSHPTSRERSGSIPAVPGPTRTAATWPGSEVPCSAGDGAAWSRSPTRAPTGGPRVPVPARC